MTSIASTVSNSSFAIPRVCTVTRAGWALLDDRLDVIATDHAPHTLSEKGYFRDAKGSLTPFPKGHEKFVPYEQAHAGLPLVQHPLQLMLLYVQQGKLTLEKLVEKMSHAVATCYQIADRGFIREGYHADLVLLVGPVSAVDACGRHQAETGWCSNHGENYNL